MRGQWADHESHDFVSNMKSGNHEIIAEEEMDEPMLPLCKFCQFPNHTQYQVTGLTLCETTEVLDKIFTTHIHMIFQTMQFPQCVEESHFYHCVGKE